MKRLIPVFLAIVITVPWVYSFFTGHHGSPMLTAGLAGLAILGAAFLLSWAAELAQLDISGALAVALLSLIAVLPEYAVDIYFAWQAGQDPTYAPYAVANMTGANRLLIGIGWSAVVLVFWWKTRRRLLHLGKKDRLELGALTLATLYAVTIPFKGSLSLIDTAVLITLFIMYIRVASRQGVEEPDLMGPCAVIGCYPPRPRRTITVSFFIYAAAVILISAEPFAEGLVESGSLLGIDEFLLVQWLAPLASEAPEFIVAILFTLQGRAALGIRTMISSKVNQWTLLIGMLPLAFALSSGSFSPMPLDERQAAEVALTVAQSIFAVAILARFDFSVGAALTLVALFTTQLLVPALHEPFIIVYVALAVGLFVLNPQRLTALARASRSLVAPGRGTAGSEPE